MQKLLIVSPNNYSVGIYTLLNPENGEKINSILAANPVAAVCQLSIEDYSDQVGKYRIIFLEQQSDISKKEIIQKNKDYEEWLGGYSPDKPILN